jgi:DNA/RNA-binding domain of Phe-tRNA-synthetase-like protein
MKFFVTEDVFAKIPDAKFGLVSVNGADNSGSSDEIEAMLSENVKKVEEHFAGKKVKNEPELQPYREAFRAIGVNPNRYMCAAEALMTRIAKGQGMPVINTIVDLGNAVSLKYGFPIGAHDLDTMIDGAFGVRTAVEGDTFLPFGADEREPVPEGEVVYATGSHVRTRRWTWRQGDEGKITEETSHVLFIIDGFADREDDILEARKELAGLAGKYLGGTVKEGLIDRDHLEFETEA